MVDLNKQQDTNMHFLTTIGVLAQVTVALSPRSETSFDTWTLTDVLRNGPLVQMDYDAAGQVQAATAIVLIQAPRQVVWDTIANVRAYKTFMPRVVSQEVLDSGSDVLEVSTVLETPFVNTSYVLRYTFHPREYRLDLTWVSGDLEGSVYQWLLLEGPREGTTLGFYYGKTQNFSALIARLEDPHKTMSLGVNVATVLAVAQAIKARSEARPR
jgi:hypothetical protein